MNICSLYLLIFFGFKSTYLNTADPEAIRNAILTDSKILYIETPANPTMDITDIVACVAIVREHNLTLVVDITFCSQHRQNPLELGADILFHSMTKFIKGMSRPGDSYTCSKCLQCVGACPNKSLTYKVSL